MVAEICEKGVSSEARRGEEERFEGCGREVDVAEEGGEDGGEELFERLTPPVSCSADQRSIDLEIKYTIPFHAHPAPPSSSWVSAPRPSASKSSDAP